MATQVLETTESLDYREFRLNGAKAEVYSVGYDVRSVVLIAGTWVNNGNGGEFTEDTTFDRVVYDVESDYNLKLLVEVLNALEDAEFTQESNKAFSVYYRALEGGSLTGNVLQTVTYGQNATPVAAVPDSDYDFSAWSDGSTDNPRLDAIVKEHINVIAEFVLKTFDIHYMIEDDVMGRIDGEQVQTITIHGDTTEVLVAPASGYLFYEWDDGSIENPRYDTDINEDAIHTATCLEGDYYLKYSDDNNGAVSGDLRQIVADGADGTEVEAIPLEGYRFHSWDDDVLDNPRTDTAVSSGVDAIATFSEGDWVITYHATAGGTIDGAEHFREVLEDGAVGTTVTAVPDEGYVFDHWDDAFPTAERNLSSATEDLTATAYFVSE